MSKSTAMGESKLRPGMRLAGAGMELAFTALLGGTAGWLVDRQAGLPKPYFSAFGGLVGFAFGMFRLIKTAIALNSDALRVKQSSAERNAECSVSEQGDSSSV